MNTPLLFINTPNHINNDGSQHKYDSRITNNFNFSPYEKQIKELALIYSNGIRVLAEISTKNKIYVGHITSYARPIVNLKDEIIEYQVNINDVEKLNIVKIGV